MNSSILDSCKIKIVKAIKEGLFDAHTEYNKHSMRLKNGQHFYKMDKIGNEVIDRLSMDANFKVITIKRGSYELALLYYLPTGSIFTLMSKRRHKELVNRQNLVNVHYLDALVEFNSSIQFERNQIVMEDVLEYVNGYEKHDIMNQVRNQLDGSEPTSYMTIVFDMHGYELVSVESVLTSEHLEIMYTEDWSQFIELDYRMLEINEVTSNIDNDDHDLNITIKTNRVRKEDVS